MTIPTAGDTVRICLAAILSGAMMVVGAEWFLETPRRQLWQELGLWMVLISVVLGTAVTIIAAVVR